MKKLLIATHNKAKLEELTLGLTSFIKEITIVSLDDLQVTDDPEETGKTFDENARLKALFYGNKTGLPTLADDGGLHIEILKGEPGVKSRRWIGREATDDELISHTLKKLKGLPKEKRTAYLKTTLCFFDPLTQFIMCEGEQIKGYIAEKESGNPTHGYPYRALFIPDQFQKYYDELTDHEHLKINHRLKALKRLLKKIRSHLIQ